MSKFFTGIDDVDRDYPIGTILIYSGVMTNQTTIPGWLCCDGSGYKSSTYLDLYNVIGIRYGNGDGGVNTDFNVPNMMGIIPIGNGLFNDVSGNITGENNTTISINQMPYHNHNITGGIAGAGSHSHTLYRSDGTTKFRGHRQMTDWGQGIWWEASEGAKDSRFNIWKNSDLGTSGDAGITETLSNQSGNHNHGGTITVGNSNGSSVQVNITPINCSMFYIIKY